MITTPRPWPEATKPTAVQFHAWFVACTPAEQLEISTRMLEWADRASTCFEADHDSLLITLEHAHDALRRAYRETRRYSLAWRSARRRGVWLLNRRLQAGERGIRP